MNDREILQTRIAIAYAALTNPDSIGVVDIPGEGKMFTLDGFEGFDMLLGFEEVPTVDRAREEIKELYLQATELEFDIEYEHKPRCGDV